MPNAVETTACLAHALTPLHERRVTEATTTLTRWLDTATRPYVPLSGGKDSAVVLHLTRALDPSVPALYADHEFALPETLTYLDGIPNLTRVAYRRWHTDWFTSWDVPPGETPDNLPPNTLWWDGEDGLRGWARAQGFDGSAVGLRADESRARRAHIRKNGTLFYAKKNAAWHALPLAHWTDQDVWAYLLTRHAPYSAAYDRLSEMGIPLRDQRTGPFAVERALWNGNLLTLKRGWPAEYARFATAHPGAKAYA